MSEHWTCNTRHPTLDLTCRLEVGHEGLHQSPRWSEAGGPLVTWDARHRPPPTMVPGPGRPHTAPPRSPWWLLRNSDGRRDGAWTACVATLLVLYVGLLVGGSEAQLGALTLRIPVPGGESVAVIVTTVGAYVWRRRARAQEQGQ